MSDITREEIDAKLETAAAKAEIRFVELSGKIDRVVDAINTVGDRVSNELGVVKTELGAVKTDSKFTRWTIIIAVITSLIAGIGVPHPVLWTQV